MHMVRMSWRQSIWNNSIGGSMLKKISLLTALVFAGTIFAVSPAHADGIRAHGDSEGMDKGFSSDADRIPDYRREVRGDSFILNVDRFSMFDRDSFEDRDSDSHSGMPKTAEWIWWLESDKDKKQSNDDPVVSAPEPASMFLLGSGLLALVTLRRRVNLSTPIS